MTYTRIKNSPYETNLYEFTVEKSDMAEAVRSRVTRVGITREVSLAWRLNSAHVSLLLIQ